MIVIKLILTLSLFVIMLSILTIFTVFSKNNNDGSRVVITKPTVPSEVIVKTFNQNNPPKDSKIKLD